MAPPLLSKCVILYLRYRLPKILQNTPIAAHNINLSNNAARAGGTISIWIPAVLYVASGVFPFLNKIDFQLEKFIKLYLMLGEHTGVIISEYILVSFLQPAILFVFVSLLLFCLRMIGLGKGLNFRRGTHILFSILLSVAYLAKPFYAA